MTNGNESAFPEVQTEPQFNRHSYGLTKREYFAAMAMQGILAGRLMPTPQEIVCQGAVEHADELIEALNKEFIAKEQYCAECEKPLPAEPIKDAIGPQLFCSEGCASSYVPF
jgi:hypothetical protein